MPKRFYWINFLLILIVFFLAVKNYAEWTDSKPREKEVAVAKQKTMTSPGSAPTAEKKGSLSSASFKVISEKNLFSPERKEFPVPMTAEGKSAPVRPNVTLYGVTIGREFQSAVIANPGRKLEKGERETMTVKVGDKVGDYSVAKILEDRITMGSNGDSFDVLLYDPARQKKRPVVAATPKPGQVTPPAPKPPAPVPIPPTPQVGTPPQAGQALPPTGRLPARSLFRQRMEQRRLQMQPGSPPQPQIPSPQPQPNSKQEEEEEDD